MNHKLKYARRLLVRAAIMLALTTAIAHVSTRCLGLSCGLDACLLLGMLITHPFMIVLRAELNQET